MTHFKNGAFIQQSLLLGMADYGYEEDGLVVSVIATSEDLHSLQIGESLCVNIIENDFENDNTTTKYDIYFKKVVGGYMVEKLENIHHHA